MKHEIKIQVIDKGENVELVFDNFPEELFQFLKHTSVTLCAEEHE